MKQIQFFAVMLMILGLSSLANAKPLFGYPTYSRNQIPHVLYNYEHCQELCEAEQSCEYPGLSGFFIGLKGGYGFAKGKQETGMNDSFNGSPLTFSKPQKATLSANDGLLGALLGFDYYFDNHYMLGLEAAAKLTFLKTKQDMSASNRTAGLNPATFSGGSFHVKSKESYEVALRFGKLICDCVLPYVKVGADFTKFKTKLETESQIITTGFESFEKKHKQKIRPGILVGLGFELPLCGCYTFGGEVVHTQYKSIHTSFATATNAMKSKIRLYSTALTARVTYKF
jgi:opacity protein-like surface antigen